MRRVPSNPKLSDRNGIVPAPLVATSTPTPTPMSRNVSTASFESAVSTASISDTTSVVAQEAFVQAMVPTSFPNYLACVEQYGFPHDALTPPHASDFAACLATPQDNAELFPSKVPSISFLKKWQNNLRAFDSYVASQEYDERFDRFLEAVFRARRRQGRLRRMSV